MSNLPAEVIGALIAWVSLVLYRLAAIGSRLGNQWLREREEGRAFSSATTGHWIGR